MKKVFSLKGIDCANCASKVEKKISDLDGVNSANINFFMEKMTVDIADEGMIEKIIDLVKKVEPQAVLRAL